MRCPTLTDLPAPPPAKTGWPWTAQSDQLPDTMPDGEPWPRVTIVTPSYNQGQFIEETIRSVLLQGYPNLEYIIIDGGSTDGSVDFIRKYDPWLAHWVSEPDEGQSHALNKGFTRATGSIVAWLNSDDTYEPNAIRGAIQPLIDDPDVGLVFGDCNVIDEAGGVFAEFVGQPFLWDRQLLQNQIPQPSVFLRKNILDQVGGVDQDLHCIMDSELWLRIADRAQAAYLPKTWANFRVCQGTKSTTRRHRFAEEHVQVAERYAASHANGRAAVADEAIRRWHLIAGIEAIRAGDNERAANHLTESFAGDRHPCPDLESLSWLIISRVSHASFLPVDGHESNAILDGFLSSLPSSNIGQKVRAHFNMVRAFQAHSECHTARAARFGALALLSSPHAWSNHGLLRLIIRSLSKEVRRMVLAGPLALADRVFTQDDRG